LLVRPRPPGVLGRRLGSLERRGGVLGAREKAEGYPMARPTGVTGRGWLIGWPVWISPGIITRRLAYHRWRPAWASSRLGKERLRRCRADLAARHGIRQLLQRLAVEGALAKQPLMERDAEAELIGARIGGPLLRFTLVPLKPVRDKNG